MEIREGCVVASIRGLVHGGRRAGSEERHMCRARRPSHHRDFAVRPRHGRSWRCIALACAIAALSGACNQSPTGPSDPNMQNVVGLDVECPSSLLIGENAGCLAVALLSPAGDRLVSREATWSSTRGDTVAVDSNGTITGRSAGEAT